MTRKKSSTSTIGVGKLKLPTKNEQFAVVREMSGGSRMIALCEDGHMRMVRIPGKFKKRMWVRANDLIIIKPWPVQEDSRADMVYRYKPTQRNRVLRRGIVPEELNVWQ